MIAYEEVVVVAEALFEADDDAPDCMAWGAVDQSVRNYYMKLAVAAIKAMNHVS